MAEEYNYNFEENGNGISFNVNDLTFETGNPILDGALNIGIRVAIVTGGALLGNLLFAGGQKVVDTCTEKIEAAKAETQAQIEQAKQQMIQQQAAQQLAAEQQAQTVPQTAPAPAPQQ